MKTDSELKSDAQAELLWDPLVPEAKVGVSVPEGVVTLTGHLDAYAEKVAARRAAERVGGVKAVAVDGSEVTLRGHVHSWAERNAADGSTWSAPGVSQVVNLLVVEA